MVKVQTDTETRRKIGRQMSLYFLNHGISHKDVAERMGISQQTVDNHTHGATIGRKMRDAYFLVFGFEPEFLHTGKGSLLKKTSGYQKIKQENEQLRALVKAQRSVIENLKKEMKKTRSKGIVPFLETPQAFNQ